MAKTKEQIEEERFTLERVLANNIYFLGVLGIKETIKPIREHYPLSEQFIQQDTYVPEMVEEVTRLVVQEQTNTLQRWMGVPDIIESIIYARTGSYSDSFGYKNPPS